MTAAPLPQSGGALEVRDLARSFGHVRALRGVSFRLEKGQVLAIFGPNGAGKTTLLRLLAGVLRPDRGEITIDGRPLVPGEAAGRPRLRLISPPPLLPYGLTPPPDPAVLPPPARPRRP